MKQHNTYRVFLSAEITFPALVAGHWRTPVWEVLI